MAGKNFGFQTIIKNYKTMKKVVEVAVSKIILLHAIVNIYREYENKTHTLQVSRCALCVVYNKNNRNTYKRNCTNCPMTVFKGTDAYPCMNRKCRPVDCQLLSPIIDKQLNAVLNFYKKFIKVIENISEEEFQATDFKFLEDLDSKTAKRHRL